LYNYYELRNIKELYGINRYFAVLGVLSVFARKDCGSHRLMSIGAVGFRGNVYRMRKRCEPV
jgi:hypothetical protein